MYAQTASKSARVLANAALSAIQTVATRLEEEEGHWPAWKVALVFAILSGLSLPLGALLGIWMTPSEDAGDDESEERIERDNFRQKIVAYGLAFGAGALLFAVTVELYGEAMRELEEDGYINGSIEVCVMVACAMLGALVYTFSNRWLENLLLEEEGAVGEEFPVARETYTVHETVPLASPDPALSSRKLPQPSQRRFSVLDGAAGTLTFPGQQKPHCRGRSAASFMLMDQMRNVPSLSRSEPLSPSHSTLSPSDARESRPSQAVPADDKSELPKGTPAQSATESLATLTPVSETKSSLYSVQEIQKSPRRNPSGGSEGESSSGRSETFDGAVDGGPSQKGPKSPLILGMATWLGVFIDGLPEGVLLGFLAAEGRLSVALVVSLFLANFPEAFSSACLLREAKKPVWAILGLWTLLLVLTAGLAGLAALAYPSDGDVPFHWKLAVAAIEGIAGGAMLACIAAVMLPEAYHLQGDAVGIVVVAGFITSVLVKVLGGVVSEHTVGISHSTQHHTHHLFLAKWN